MNRLVRRTKGCYSKTDGMLALSIALGWLMLGGFSRPARVENALPRDWRRYLGDVDPSYPSPKMEGIYETRKA